MTGAKGTPGPTRVDEPRVHVVLGHPRHHIASMSCSKRLLGQELGILGWVPHLLSSGQRACFPFRAAIKGAPKQAEKVAVGSETPIWPRF